MVKYNITAVASAIQKSANSGKQGFMKATNIRIEKQINSEGSVLMFFNGVVPLFM
jgi:hypothetical protein